MGGACGSMMEACGCGGDNAGATTRGDGFGVARLCPDGHPMVKAQRAMFNCDACRETFWMGEDCYVCNNAAHRFDGCDKCTKQQRGCPKGHILVAVRMRTAWACDSCKKPNKTIGSLAMCCRTCHWFCGVPGMCDCLFNANAGSAAPAATPQPIAAANNNNNSNNPLAGGGAGTAPAKPPPKTDAQIQGMITAIQQIPPTPALQKPPSPTDMKALFIGINYPASSAELSGCVNDVFVMMKLVQELGFTLKSGDNTRVLVDDRSFKGRTGHPTRKEILEGLKWLVAGATPSSTLFWHYSGHGAQERDKTGDELDGINETIVPCDYESAGMILDDDIFGLLKTLPAGCRLTVIADCCHSATLIDLANTWRWSGEQAKFTLPPRNRDFTFTSKKALDATVIALSGCQDEQTSADVSNVATFGHDFGKDSPGKAGGALTNAVAAIIHERNGAKGDGKVSISFMELLYRVQQNLKTRRYTQVPQLTCSKRFDMNLEFTLFGDLTKAA
jgi:hypothetical protein